MGSPLQNARCSIAPIGSGWYAAAIRQIEFELEKAERGMAMPYDAENVARLRNMLREARKQKLSAGVEEEAGEGSPMTSR